MFQQADPLIQQATTSATDGVRAQAAVIAAQIEQTAGQQTTVQQVVEQLRGNCEQFSKDIEVRQEKMNATLQQAHEHVRTMAVQLQQGRESQEALSQGAAARIMELKAETDAQFGSVTGYVDKMVVDIKSEVEKHGAGPGSGFGGAGDGIALQHPKNTIIENLTDGMSKEDFIHWRECLDLHVESSQKWGHHAQILKQVRGLKEPVTESLLTETVRNVTEELGGNVINYLMYKCHDMNGELYRLLWPRLSVEYRRMCNKVKGHDGFEVYRLISRGKDVVYAMTRRDLKSQVMNLGHQQATTLKGTHELLTEIESQAKEFYTRFNEEIEDEDLARTLWKGMDPSTQDLAIILRHNQDSTFEDLSEFVESRYSAHTYRAGSQGRRNMDVGTVVPQ